MATSQNIAVEINSELVKEFNRIRDAVFALKIEVNCRIEHGAESGGHLEYVQSKLDEIMQIDWIDIDSLEESTKTCIE